ncbi:MAG: hypothetical protein ABF296_02535 [Oceanococcaceae bacterium]
MTCAVVAGSAVGMTPAIAESTTSWRGEDANAPAPYERTIRIETDRIQPLPDARLGCGNDAAQSAYDRSRPRGLPRQSFCDRFDDEPDLGEGREIPVQVRSAP